jgi:hypothetical protein
LRTKNKAVKIKIIPEILLNDLPDLSNFAPESFLFTPTGFGQDWVIESNNKRDYFSKRFKEVVKTHFNLNKDYGMYSLDTLSSLNCIEKCEKLARNLKLKAN